MKINWVDILIVIYVTRAVFLGKKRGFSVELISTITALLTLILTIHFYQPLSRTLNSWLLISPPIAVVTAFAFLAGGFLFIGMILGKLLKKVMKLSFTSNIEKSGGLILGTVRGIIVIAIIVVGVALMPADFIKREIYTSSFLGKYLVSLSPRIHELFWTSNDTDSRFNISKYWHSMPK